MRNKYIVNEKISDGVGNLSSGYFEAVKHLNECKKLQGRLNNARTDQTEAKFEKSLERRAEACGILLNDLSQAELGCLNYITNKSGFWEVDLAELSQFSKPNKHNGYPVEKWHTVTVDEMNKANADIEQECLSETANINKQAKDLKEMLKQLKTK
jgi:hypothetical protein